MVLIQIMMFILKKSEVTFLAGEARTNIAVRSFKININTTKKYRNKFTKGLGQKILEVEMELVMILNIGLREHITLYKAASDPTYLKPGGT